MRLPAKAFVPLVAATIIVIAGLATQTAEATFPGKNGKLAYFRCVYDDCGLHVVNPDGTGEQRLVAGAGAGTWSADGRKLAYNDEGAINVINADGTGMRRLPRPELRIDFEPTWSPDGEWIAFTTNRFTNRGSGILHIGVMRSDGSDVRQLSFGSFWDSHANWSPDGTKIAFTRNFRSTWELAVMNADGSDPHMIVPVVQGFAAEWSPDGERILFHRTYSTISTVKPDGSDVRDIGTFAGGTGWSTWSPDGRLVALSKFPDPGSVSNRPKLYTIDGSGLARLTASTAPEVHENHPDWQPIPPPQRADFKNGPSFCRADRAHWGEAEFGQRYGGGVNAFGKCVSGN